MPFQSEKQRRWMWKNKPDMAKKWTAEHGSEPVKAGLGALVAGLARRAFRKKATAYADSSQAKIMGDHQGKLLDHFKNRYNQQPIQAKKGKFQEFEHPQHNITPIEHMEEKVSSRERIERLLEKRKAKKESKKKLVTAQEGQLIREKTRGVGAAIKGTDHYVMQGMDAAQEGKLIQVPTRGTGAAVKGTDHYVMQGMNAAKTGKMIKAKDSKYIQKKKWWSADKLKSTVSKLKEDIQFIKDAKAGKLSPSLTEKAKKKILNLSVGEGYDKEASGSADEIRKIIKQKPSIVGDEAKGGQSFTPGWKPHLSTRSVKTAKKGSYLTTDLKGYSHKKVSSKTHQKFMKLFKHREAGGWKEAKGYKKHLKALKKMTTKPSSTVTLGGIKFNKKFNWKAANKALGAFPLINRLTPKKGRMDTSKFLKRRMPLGTGFNAAMGKAKKLPLTSPFLKRRFTLAGPSSLPGAKALSVLKKVGKRTAIGKVVNVAGKVGIAGTAAYGLHQGLDKLGSHIKKKKKVTKKSIGGETVIMKSGGGYIDDLL